MIWDAAIYCTLVARDIDMVELCCTLAYKPRRKRSPWDEGAALGGAGYSDRRTAGTALVGSQMT
jgi:hypothetical protein